jgi:transmembrane sensor
MRVHIEREIEILLTKYLEKSCTPGEKQQLYELLSDSDNEKPFKEILFSHLNDFIEDQKLKHIVDFDRIYNQMLSEIKHREIRESEERLLKRKIKIRKSVIQGLSLAAVFCIAFFLGSINKRNNGEIFTKPAVETTFNEIKAPLGARSEVKLSDGTQVILNAGSSLKYHSDYNMNNRDLILEGEAYFKVARNVDLPLIVNAGNISIRATGTEFNIKAYSEEEIIETTLIEGKVEISQKNENSRSKMLVLLPNQKAIYVKKSDQITLGKIKEAEPLAVRPPKIDTDRLLVSQKTDVDQVTAWTHNKLIIRSENLENLCIKLQRKYNVTFIFGNEEIKNCRFSGILFDETLEQVLNVIKLTAPIDYVVDGKIVLLVSNKEQVGKYSKHMKKYSN